MQIFHTIAELRQALKSQDSIAFVPTMGNLHAGHLHLVEIAKQSASCVVVSIFVNPLQFGPNEDLDNYPRSLEQDLAKLTQAGAHIVFAPSVAEMYPSTQTMRISPPAIAQELCGAARPGHFDGVATVVMKLFNIVFSQHAGTHTAVFGKKDFQQLCIMRELIAQFNLEIKLIAGETVREADGLAMSSRNAYLNAMQRHEAPRLQKSLKLIAAAITQGNRDFSALEQQTTQFLTQLGWIVDYIAIRSAQTLLPAHNNDKALIVLGAARLGSTRLIDNVEV